MGNFAAAAKRAFYKEKVDNATDVCKPLFEQLNFVTIGCHCAGKSEVCNAILGKKTFRFWYLWKKTHVKDTHEASGRRITVTRAPGWNENNLSQRKVQTEILSCVNKSFKAGLHAVVFVVNANRPFSDQTTRTLEGFLPEKVWDHTIVVLHNAEADGDELDAILQTDRSLQNLIQKCGNRCCVLNRKSICGVIDSLEEMIAEKKSIYFGKNVEMEEKAKKSVIKKLRCNIECLKKQRNENLEQLEEVPWKNKKNELQKIIALIDVEIRNLQEICHKQEEELESLRQEKCSDVSLQGCQQLPNKDQQIAQQEEEIAQPRAIPSHVGPVPIRCKNKRWPRQKWRRQQWRWKRKCGKSKRTKTLGKEKLHPGETPCLESEWSKKLLEILNNLTKREFKEFMFHLRQQITIPEAESLDRVDLADIMLKVWGTSQCISKTEDLLKDIQRNDLVEKLNTFRKGESFYALKSF
ncbi:GTPase IMAP family member 7-like [Clupea harengus]|uniref:GTPase IMAP family member 7-like n=1 Tax=Clupea harengus TaxID=7950 RepID=A0A6P8GRV9_CLUHA|nr:GTPase IMAP family member 7-like [Clupea harengus]